jgi:hypothetical protein
MTNRIDRAAAEVGTKHFVRFDGMTWPRADDSTCELSWLVRYSPSFDATPDRYVLASMLDAYVELVNTTARKREAVVRQLRATLRPEEPRDGE